MVWDKEIFGNINHIKNKIGSRLEGVQKTLANHVSLGFLKLELKLKVMPNNVLRQEVLWYQKSHVA